MAIEKESLPELETLKAQAKSLTSAASYWVETTGILGSEQGPAWYREASGTERIGRIRLAARLREMITTEVIPYYREKAEEKREQIENRSTLVRAREDLLDIRRLAEAGFATHEMLEDAEKEYEALTVAFFTGTTSVEITPQVSETPEQPEAPEQPPVTPVEVTPEIPVEIVPTPEAPGTEIFIDPRRVKEDPKMAQFLERIPEPAKVLIEQFFESKYATWLFAQIKDFQPADDKEKKNFMQELAGQIFEQLGYLHLTQVFRDPDTFVLSPQEVLELYKRIYPNRKVSKIRENGLNSGIEGTTIPDGLIIKNTGSSLAIEEVIDYKLWSRSIPKPEAFNRQLGNYRYPQFVRDFWLGESRINPLIYGQIIHGLRSEVPIKSLSVNPGYKVIYGLPENSSVKFPADDIETRYIPIDSRDFGYFVDLLIEAVKNLPASSLEEEIQGRIIESFDEIEFLEPSPEKEKLPLILVDLDKKEINIEGVKRIARKGVKWELLLYLLRNANQDIGTRILLNEMHRIEPNTGYNSVGSLMSFIRQFIEPDFRIPRILQRSGWEETSSYRINAEVRFIGEPSPTIPVEKGPEIKPEQGELDDVKLEQAKAYIESIKSLIEKGVLTSSEHLQRVQEIAGRLGIPFELSREEPELEEAPLRLTPDQAVILIGLIKHKASLGINIDGYEFKLDPKTIKSFEEILDKYAPNESDQPVNGNLARKRVEALDVIEKIVNDPKRYEIIQSCGSDLEMLFDYFLSPDNPEMEKILIEFLKSENPNAVPILDKQRWVQGLKKSSWKPGKTGKPVIQHFVQTPTAPNGLIFRRLSREELGSLPDIPKGKRSE